MLQSLSSPSRRLAAGRLPSLCFAAFFLSLVVVAFTISSTAPSKADTRDDEISAREIVSEAIFTLEKMKDHRDFKNAIHKFLGQAKAVVIFPNIVKGGFFLGGEGGNGVLLARTETGEWSYPSFMALGSGSIGLQFGLQRAEVLLIVNSGKGLEAILDNKVKIGAEISAAIGPNGSGAEASVTTNLNVDILSYSVGEGAFIGAGVEGAGMWSRQSLNTAYYNSESATARTVVINGEYANSDADALRRALRDFHQ